MRPQRASKRYTATREDYQIDPREHSLPEVEVSPIPCGAGGQRKYRLAIKDSTDRICDLKSLEDWLGNAGVTHISTLENMLNSLLDVIPRYIAETGNSVRIGNLVTLKPYATGTLDNANDAPDPAKNHLEIRATISPALRHSLAKARLVNVKSSRNAISFLVNDMNGAERDVLDSSQIIHVDGHDIYVPKQSATDEGARGRVWFETLDGNLLARCEVQGGGPDLIIVRLDRPVASVEARVVVETYGTKEAAATGDQAALSRHTHTVRFL